VVDHATRDLHRAVQDADLIVFCTPIAQMQPLCLEMVSALKPGAVVTDVGSVKGTVVQDLEGIISAAGGHFIGSHPMAGAEKTGVSSARADLFQNAICVVTPTSKSNSSALNTVLELWKSLNSRVIQMSPDHHDDMVCRASHLPHVIAAELANYVLSPIHPKEQSTLCATGFRDTTRIASGSPEMWKDIVLANRKNLLRVLGVFIEDIQEFALAVEKGDVEAINEFFNTAKQRRDAWISQSQSPE
jgi:prephenate dehydrogenase